MAKRKERREAVLMRQKGMSYSQIRSAISVSKSTLSNWLRDMPLSPERISELRGKNPQRIERYRNTMLRKKNLRLENTYAAAAADIGSLSVRELLIAGIFLYWGEGSKTAGSTVALSNTDASMLRFFIRWTEALGIPREKLQAKLQLYSDMDIGKETEYWIRETGLGAGQFEKPYVKESRFSALTYSGFGHGTCIVRFYSRPMIDYILMALKHVRTAPIA